MSVHLFSGTIVLVGSSHLMNDTIHGIEVTSTFKLSLLH